MKKVIFISAIICVMFAVNSCRKTEIVHFFHGTPYGNTVDAQVAHDWYGLQYRLLLERNTTLIGASFAYIGIALYESVRHGINGSVSFSQRLYQMPQMPATDVNKTYDWQVSANAALASMLRSYNTNLTTANMASIDSLENAYNQKLQAGAGASFNRSQAFGRSIATAVYFWSLTDGYNGTNVGWIPPVFVGAWVPTPPAFTNGINPYVGNARPLLETDLNIVAPPPTPYSLDPNSDFYKIQKAVYDVSLTLTTEQKNIALFWVDQGNGTGYTPDGHNFTCVTQALQQANAGLFIAAEAYAKAGIADREGAIVCFRSKYTYNTIRPVSYIQRIINPDWLPFIPTPPHPEYPAAHAFVTGTVMQATAKVLGDNISFTDHTYDFRGWAPRKYATLFAAAEESGISRLYGGIHCLPSINVGLSMARELGDKIGKLNMHD
jgi:hypothetical protein